MNSAKSACVPTLCTGKPPTSYRVTHRAWIGSSCAGQTGRTRGHFQADDAGLSSVAQLGLEKSRGIANTSVALFNFLDRKSTPAEEDCTLTPSSATMAVSHRISAGLGCS